MPFLYHTVHVQNDYTLREAGPVGKVVKKWIKKANCKTYSWKEAGVDQPRDEALVRGRGLGCNGQDAGLGIRGGRTKAVANKYEEG
ncbi:hypothetical protein CGRA01v4_09947 [Colletotrichum graminicola]|nr:hypothetical protein CGRA01v4_09947 [Colletotrichum graminicola]